MQAYLDKIVVGFIILVMNVGFGWIISNTRETIKELKKGLSEANKKNAELNNVITGFKSEFNSCIFNKSQEEVNRCEVYRTKLWEEINKIKLDAKEFIERSECNNREAAMTAKIEDLNDKTGELGKQLIGVEKDMDHVSSELVEINKGVDDLLEVINEV